MPARTEYVRAGVFVNEFLGAIIAENNKKGDFWKSPFIALIYHF